MILNYKYPAKAEFIRKSHLGYTGCIVNHTNQMQYTITEVFHEHGFIINIDYNIINIDRLCC